MTRINEFFSTRTLLQIVTILSATLAMKLMQGGYDLGQIAFFAQ